MGLVEARIVGVVGAAHRVDVVLLHQCQVATHVVQVHHRAGLRVGVVAVDTPQGERPPVEMQDGVLHADLTHAHPVGDDLVRTGHDQGVKVWVLGAPQVGVEDVEHSPVAEAVPAHEGGEGSGGNYCTRGVAQLQGGGHRLSTEARSHLDGGCCLSSQHGGGGVVEQDRAWAVQQVDVPDDAAGTELVLVLEVGPVAPLEHEHGQPVVPRTNKAGDVELAGGVRDLAVPHVAAVEPYVEAGIHPLEVQVGARRVVPDQIVEIPDVAGARVVLRDVGRVERNGVADVGVLMLVVTEVLPRTWYLDRGEVPGRVVRCVEALGEVVDAG